MDLTSKEYATERDNKDPLGHLRDQFIIPSRGDLARRTLQSSAPEEDSIQPSTYLCGNSLGLQPRLTQQYFRQYLGTWATKGVYGHFKEVNDTSLPPWLNVDDDLQEDMAKIIGAKAAEVAVMQTLTANLHLMMASFYRPTKERWKIILEGKAFPSDHVCAMQHCDPATDNANMVDSMLLNRRYDIMA